VAVGAAQQLQHVAAQLAGVGELLVGHGELLSLFADCAERAERLRQRGAEVVFVTGAELSLMNNGHRISAA
jgi:hypothetical protein